MSDIVVHDYNKQYRNRPEVKERQRRLSAEKRLRVLLSGETFNSYLVINGRKVDREGELKKLVASGDKISKYLFAERVANNNVIFPQKVFFTNFNYGIDDFIEYVQNIISIKEEYTIQSHEFCVSVIVHSLMDRVCSCRIMEQHEEVEVSQELVEELSYEQEK